MRFMKIMSIDMARYIAHLVQIGQWVTGPRGKGRVVHKHPETRDLTVVWKTEKKPSVQNRFKSIMTEAKSGKIVIDDPQTALVASARTEDINKLRACSAILEARIKDIERAQVQEVA